MILDKTSQFRLAVTAGFERLVADSGVDKTAIGTLIDRVLEFKATERKDDPTRRLGLHGPYEELVLMHTGNYHPAIMRKVMSSRGVYGRARAARIFYGRFYRA